MKIGFIGFGHLAKVLFKSWDQLQLINRSEFIFCQKNKSKEEENKFNLNIASAGIDQVLDFAEMIFLFVRPAQLDEVLDQFKHHALRAKSIISVLAGKKIEVFEPYSHSVARAMPNICSSIFKGMTALSFSEDANLIFKNQTQLLFDALGKTLIIPEKQMDAACAMAGSGPGFILYLIQIMVDFGLEQGFTQEESIKISSQVFLGASSLLTNEFKIEDLIKQIALPGGTTEAGLRIMQQPHFQEDIKSVFFASLVKSKEISGN
jgi:pyrroline-5-carboxylate reductase